MRFLSAVVFVLMAALPASAARLATPEDGQGSAASQDPKAQAMFEFLMARRQEATGDAAAAQAALERARTLDPASGEVAAELAGFYSRQNRLSDAVATAQQALTLDKTSDEAHNVLATIYSAWAENAAPLPPGQTAVDARTKAIEHLTAIQNTPLMATNPNLQMTLGRLHMRAGKADVAIPILEKVAAQAPWAAEPQLLLYEANVALGKIDDAERALVAAAEANPRYFAQLGQFYERTNKWADAAEAYEQAIASARQPNRDLQIRYAAALINTEGGAEKAIPVINDVLKGSPNDTRVLFLLSNAQRATGDEKGAEATARKIISIDPTNIGGLRALVSVLFERFDYKQVSEVVTPLLKDPSRAKGREFDGAAVLVQLGIAEQQMANWDGAIAAFSAAKTLTPDDPDLDAYLVQANLTARRFDRAEAVARAALDKNPNQPRMVRLRAQALLKGGKAAEANTLMEAGVAKFPTSREFVVGLADLYADQKRTDDAVRMLEQARKVFGDDQALTMRLANVYETGGRIADAERELRKLMAADPLNADALNSLSYLLAEHGLKLPEAVDLAQRALKIEPGNPAFLDTLGWALFKQGRTDDAAAAIEKSAAMLTGNSAIQDHHGDVLARRGRTVEAIAAWQRALNGDGEAIDRAAVEKKINAAKAKQK